MDAKQMGEGMLAPERLAEIEALVTRKEQKWLAYVDAMNSPKVTAERLYDAENAYNNASWSLATAAPELLAHAKALAAENERNHQALVSLYEVVRVIGSPVGMTADEMRAANYGELVAAAAKGVISLLQNENRRLADKNKSLRAALELKGVEVE